MCVGLILASLAGCATSARIAEIDAKYDAIIAKCFEDGNGKCWNYSHFNQNRQREKEYANSPLRRFFAALGYGCCGTGSNQTFVRIMN